LFQDDTSEGGADELGLDNVGGVFLVLVAGLALACIVAFLEMTCHNYNKARKQKVRKVPLRRDFSINRPK